MKRQALSVLISIAVGGIFLWLALRNVDPAQIRFHFGQMQYGWIPFFAVAVLASSWIRAARWGMLFRQESGKIPVKNLFAALMVGQFTNYAVPRLGEITRSVYLSKKQDISGSAVLGTVVLERIVDLITLGLMLIGVLIFAVADRRTLRELLGPEMTRHLRDMLHWEVLLIALAALVLGCLILYFIWQYLRNFLEYEGRRGKVARKVRYSARMFGDGLLSFARIRNWPVFILLTIAMWFFYLMMTYVPFYGFGIELGLAEAFSVMVIGTIGIVLPSPGAIGTYHWFTRQTLYVLFAVPMAVGVTYAIVTHAMVFIVVAIATPICLFISGYTKGDFSSVARLDSKD